MLHVTRSIAPGGRRMLKIELAFKGKILKQIETDKSEISIGRGNNNDIQIDNLGVSKTHAKII